jgi:biotin carboxylase
VRHVLVVELPGGSDADILSAIVAGGDRFSLLTAAGAHYRDQTGLGPILAMADNLIEVPHFTTDDVLDAVTEAGRLAPFDAVICLQDLRIAETAQLAERLGFRHLNPKTAALARDKSAIRQRLADMGIAQPPFRRVCGYAQLIQAIEELGLPLIIKPVDGFGSQNVFSLRTQEDVEALLFAPDTMFAPPDDYGLGNKPSGEMLVERLMSGRLVGCDSFTAEGQHRLLTVNEKVFFPPSSFAIRGGCLETNVGQFAELESYLVALLDAIGFDHGAAHVEIMITAQGPQLVEVNPRLVGARIPRLVSAALGRSIHTDLVALHCDGLLPEQPDCHRFAVTRWLAAQSSGVLGGIDLPDAAQPGIAAVEMLKTNGDPVTPPFDNGDRIGYVMTVSDRRVDAIRQAEAFVAGSWVRVVSPTPSF